MRLNIRFVAFCICISMIFMSMFCVSAQGKIEMFDFYISLGVWQGTDDVSAVVKYDGGDIRINNALEFSQFESLYYNGEKVDNSIYSAENVEDYVKITIKESFIDTLKDGVYVFTAMYKNISCNLKLYVVTTKETVNDIVFNFGKWNGTDNASFKITGISQCLGSELVEFISLNGEKLRSDSYAMSFYGNNGVIVLLSDYLKTLPVGVHEFSVEFMSVSGITLKVEIPSFYKKGDANNDGEVTAADARIILRCAAQLFAISDEAKFACDINSDGNITSSDARRILRVAAQIETF